MILNKANKLLLNQRIVKIEYESTEESQQMCWNKRAISFQLENGIWLTPTADDECNEAGAMLVSSHELSLIPTETIK